MASDEQLRDAMATAMAGFAAAVEAVEADQWGLPSPCAGWSVGDVVDHVVAGERFTVAVMGGASMAEAIEQTIGLDPENTDVVGQLTQASAAALAAFDGSLDQAIEHRVGSISGRLMLGFRIIDEVGHTWDVATATNQPVAIDPVTLAVGLEIATSERATLDQSENFATSPDDEVETGDPLTTFLRTIGRAPTRPTS